MEEIMRVYRKFMPSFSLRLRLWLGRSGLHVHDQRDLVLRMMEVSGVITS
jgi:hypothetical protein